MGNQGKIQLTLVFVAPPDQVEEGDRIFRSHGPWMKETHQQSGDKALLSYSLSKAPELSNPMDPSSPPTGNTCFVLTEIYETRAGVTDHFQQTASWKEFPAVAKWMGKCKMTGVAAAPIVNSLW